MKLDIWNNPAQELENRLKAAKDDRKDEERRWEEIDQILYNVTGLYGQAGLQTSESGVPSFNLDLHNQSADISVVYAFKNLRFIHSQLTSNPPVVTPRPTSSDKEDLEATDAADSLIRYGLRQYKMKETVDIGSLDAVQYGTGFYKTQWDSDKGDLLEVDEEGNYVAEGDFDLDRVSPKDMYLDPDAQVWSKIRYVFQRYFMPYEEAVYMFCKDGDMKIIKQIQSYRTNKPADHTRQNDEKTHLDVVEIYEYWETGLASNGYAGRHCWCGPDGRPLGDIEPSPYFFVPPGAKPDTPTRAKLPYHIFTDIDRPDSVWGRSFLDYVVRPQEVLNQLDSAVLDSVQAHACARVVLPEGTEIADDSLTNSPWDVVKITGSQPPFFMSPMTLPPDLARYRETMKQGVDELSGVNESMFGQQSRETAGFAMQYAVNQGSMIRRRLFDKYAMVVESIYRDYLGIIRQHWVDERVISVLGQGKAMETAAIKGADIASGFDFTVEFGAALSIDPITRREEILQLQPLFEKAGVPVKTSLKMMRLAELSELYDVSELADRKQKFYIDYMVANEEYKAPGLFEDHENMLIYLKQYLMDPEYEMLPQSTKDLIVKHLVDRTKMPAEESKLLAESGGQPAPAPAPAPAQPGMEQLGMVPPVETPGEMPPLGM